MIMIGCQEVKPTDQTLTTSKTIDKRKGTKTRRRKRLERYENFPALIVLLVSSAWRIRAAEAFAAACPKSDVRKQTFPGPRHSSVGLNLAMSGGSDEEDSEQDNDDFESDNDFFLKDLNWRVEKVRLEEQNKQRFLKARPRFLPYEECRKWVQAWGNRWRTKEEWRNWIHDGEKRNAYIPSEPDQYYGRLGQWISWDHFLLGTEAVRDNITERKKKGDDGEEHAFE